MTTKNPWLGLASYEEPKNDDTDYQFCGRDEETIEMVRLIDNNLFITLYGSSGIGKTSLLRAGVIPILRRKDYFPLYVRLSQEPNEIPYAEAIVRKLQNSGLTEEKGAAVKHPDAGDRLFLWEYFATTRFLSEGREVYPVIILDQFEEVFREGDKAKAELLLRQIYLLLNDELEMPDEAGWSADTNYRFVASIREDFLFVLEDSIDENSLDLYKNTRYRLRPMKPEQARQVVLVQGKDCIEETEKEAVAERIIGLAKRPQSNDIDTLLLSLVCSGTYDKKIGERIVPSDLAVWKDNPMEVYYQDAIKRLKASQIRYIQQHFIREDGSRRRVDASEARSAFGETTYRELTQGKNRLFAIGDKGQVELLHDQLGMAVYGERKVYEEQERKKKQRQRTILISLIALTLAGLSFFFFQNRKMMQNQARAVAEKALHLVDEGDSYLARLLALEVLPTDIDMPYDKPYTPEAEHALRKACMENTAILKGHTGPVHSVAFCPDSCTLIISASADSTIRVWDYYRGYSYKEMRGHTGEVNFALFHPQASWSDNPVCISAADDSTIRIWNFKIGNTLKVLRGHSDIVTYAAYSPDGKFIASASRDCTIRIWNAKTGDSIRTLFGHSSTVNHVAFNPNSKRIASASSDNTVRIWDVNTGTCLDTLKGHRDRVNSVSYNSSGSRIVTSSNDKNVLIWNVNTGKPTDSLHINNAGGINSASFNTDGNLILISSRDGLIRIWNPAHNKTDTSINRSDKDWPTYMAQKMIPDTTVLSGHKDGVSHAAFNTYGNKIASASLDGTIRIWDEEHDKWLNHKVPTFSIIAKVTSASFSPDGKYFALGDNGGNLFLRDAQTGSLIKQIYYDRLGYTGHSNLVNSVVFCSDGKTVLSASRDNTLRLWDMETGNCIKLFKGSSIEDFRHASLSSDDSLIVSASSEGFSHGCVRLWDVERGECIKTLYCDCPVNAVVFSPSNKYVASASEDGSISIWETKEWTKVKTLTGTGRYSINSIAFSQDGKYIVTASSNSNAIIWDFETGHPLHILEGHSASIRSASFSNNGKYVITASKDRTVRIWYSKTGNLVQIIRTSSSDYPFAVFSPDDQRFLVMDSDVDIIIFDFPPLQELIDKTRKRFKIRKLTPEEKRKYYLE